NWWTVAVVVAVVFVRVVIFLTGLVDGAPNHCANSSRPRSKALSPRATLRLRLRASLIRPLACSRSSASHGSDFQARWPPNFSSKLLAHSRANTSSSRRSLSKGVSVGMARLGGWLSAPYHSGDRQHLHVRGLRVLRPWRRRPVDSSAGVEVGKALRVEFDTAFRKVTTTMRLPAP